MNARPGSALLRRAGSVSSLTLCAVLVLHPFIHADRTTSSLVPTLVGLLVGLPHGAVDHLVPAWLSVKARRLRARLGLLLGYATAAGTGLWVFQAAPAAALLGFLVLSVVHFGAGDEAFHAERDARPVRLRPHGVLAYGGPPVIFPLVLWRDQVDPLLENVAAGATIPLTPEVRAVALVTAVLAITITAIGDLRAGRGGDVVQLGLLATVFAVVSPLLAFGVYFAAWHSLRHVARLLRVDPANAAQLRAGRLGAPLRRFAVRAAAPTAFALVLLVLLALLAGPDDAPGPLPSVFAVLAALTVPHATVVAWLDRHRPAGGCLPP